MPAASPRTKRQSRFAIAATPASVRASLEAIAGDRIVQDLIDAGSLVLVATQQEAVRRSEGRIQIPAGQRVGGAVDPETGTVYLIAEHIRPEDVAGLLRHEVAVHQRRLGLDQPKPRALRLAMALLRLTKARQWMGETTFAGVLAQMERERAAGNVRVVAAFEQALTAMKALKQDVNNPQLVAEEALAYLVGDKANADLPLFRRILAALRTFLTRAGFKLDLTTDDLVLLAQSALETAAQREVRAGAMTRGVYSLLNSLTPDQQFYYAAEGLRLLSANTDLFKYPKSNQRDMAAIAADLSAELKIIAPPQPVSRPGYRPEQSWVTIMPDGNRARITLKGNNREVYIDASDLIEGSSQGSLLYQLVGQWALNNDKVFIGDPNGISEPGKARRLEHLISLALKFGNTDFILPHPDQNIPWKTGEHGYNLAQMLKRSGELIQEAVPALKEMRYDFDRREFVNRRGDPVAAATFDRLSKSPRARAAQAGATTLKRSVLVNTLVQGAGREVWRPLLENLARLGGAARLDPALKGIFYSRATALGLAEPTLTADELLARVQSGELAELTPEQWAQVQQAFLGQAATVATGVNAPTFKTWFGQSKIKTKTGTPVVMYHGTPEAFTVFDAAKSGANTTHPTAALGFFFTNNQGHAAAKYGQNVMEVYLAIEKPYAMTDTDLRRIESLDDAKAFRAKLEAQGYDGIVMPAETGTRYVAAFRPDQVKFTNNETYTRGQGDMRFALAAPRTGQAPGLFEKAPVVVTQLTGKEISTDNQPWNLRNAVKAFAQKYRGQSFPNIDTQTELIIGKEGYRHLFGGNKTLPELQATAAIPELIRNAVLADIHADRKGEMQVHEMWRLYAPLEIDGRTYRVKLTVKNRTDGVRQFHELDALQIENPAVNTQEVAAIGSTPYPVRPAGRSVISIAQLLADANRDSDGQPFAPEPSISATAQRFAIAPGTPPQMTPPPNSAPAVMAISWALSAYQAVKIAAILSRRSALMARPFPFPRR